MDDARPKPLHSLCDTVKQQAATSLGPLTHEQPDWPLSLECPIIVYAENSAFDALCHQTLYQQTKLALSPTPL